VTDAIVKREPLTYEPTSPHSYFHDTMQSELRGDKYAKARLERHRTELAVELRTTTSTAGSGGDLDAPLHLQELFRTSTRGNRPLADLCKPLPLPRGTNKVTVPRLTSSSIASTETAIQVDGGTLNETSFGTSTMSAPVSTIAGTITVSQQLLDMAPQPGADYIIATELKRDYDSRLESQLLTGSGSSGQLTGLSSLTLPTGNSVTATTNGTSSTNNLQDVWTAIGKAAAAVSNSRGKAPEAILMAGRRYFWMIANVTPDQSWSPDSGGYHADAGEARDYEGNLYGPTVGLPTYIDGSIPAGTTADPIWVVRPSDMILFESEPMVQVAVDSDPSGSLGVRINFHAYVAFIPDAKTDSSGKAVAVAKVAALAQPSGY
jgi:hypothetical protein